MSESSQPRHLGDFELIRELGSGGMGTVWEAVQTSLGRRVALKLLAPHISMSASSLKRFQREAEAGARITHPNIVAVYQVGEVDGVNYIAQELVPGGATLANHLAEVAKYEGLPSDYFEKITKLFLKAAEALMAAHEAGIIHRDVKPGNILLLPDGQPKIADFGLAQIEDALELSRTGEFSGTPYYMSPEQAMSKRMGLDRRSDIFSLGASFWEALVLRRPFEGDSSYQVLQKIITEDPGPPQSVRENCPRALSQICMKALEKNPDARYQSMGELIGDLKKFLAGEEVIALSIGANDVNAIASKKTVPRKTLSCLLIATLITVPIFLIAAASLFLADPETNSMHEATIERNEQRRLDLIERNNRSQQLAAEKKREQESGLPSALQALQEVMNVLEGLEERALGLNLHPSVRFFLSKFDVTAGRETWSPLVVEIGGHLVFNSKNLSSTDAIVTYFRESEKDPPLISGTAIIKSESEWGQSVACEQCTGQGSHCSTKSVYGTYKFDLILPLLRTDSTQHLTQIDLIQHLAKEFPSKDMLESHHLSSRRTRLNGTAQWDFSCDIPDGLLTFSEWRRWLSTLNLVVPTSLNLHSNSSVGISYMGLCDFLKNASDPPDKWDMHLVLSRSQQPE